MPTLENNLKKLDEIKRLEDNWNQYGAKKIPEEAINMTSEIIQKLKYQPELFPTASQKIQLEWNNPYKDYLELLIDPFSRFMDGYFDHDGHKSIYFYLDYKDTNSLNNLLSIFMKEDMHEKT